VPWKLKTTVEPGGLAGVSLCRVLTCPHGGFLLGRRGHSICREPDLWSYQRVHDWHPKKNNGGIPTINFPLWKYPLNLFGHPNNGRIAIWLLCQACIKSIVIWWMPNSWEMADVYFLLIGITAFDPHIAIVNPIIPITKSPFLMVKSYYPILHAAVPHVFRPFCRARKLPNSCRASATNWCHRRRRRLRSLRSLRSWEARGQNRAPWLH